MLATFAKPTLVEVVTPRCVECRAMKPDLDAVAGEFDSVDLVVLDATEQPGAAAELRVLGTPTLIAVRNGAEIARVVGRRNRAELRELFAATATGATLAVTRLSRGDRQVWTVAGGAVTLAGLALGPAWPLIVAGVGLAGYANLRRR